MFDGAAHSWKDAARGASGRQLLTALVAGVELACRLGSMLQPPNLRAGWLCRAASDAELEAALDQLYPGAIADWFAAHQPLPPVTHYRDFTARQSGMYRITTMLADAQAAQVTRVCCDARHCLKRRLWTAPGLAPDAADAKSLIPCLEPCAVMLEFARKAVRARTPTQA